MQYRLGFALDFYTAYKPWELVNNYYIEHIYSYTVTTTMSCDIEFDTHTIVLSGDCYITYFIPLISITHVGVYTSRD